MTVAIPEDWVHDTDRLYLSRLSNGPLFLRALDAVGTPVLADGEVAFELVPEFADAPDTFVTTATSVLVDGVPIYQVTLPSEATSVPGPYLARWTYAVGGVARSGEQPLLVGGTAPAYDGLSWEMKSLVEQVWLRVADQFDSPMGGPHLQSYMQSHFGRNRIAQLLPKALGRLNIISQPHMTYTLDRPFPVAQWGPLLELALWIETVKHLRRSYIEQPDPVGVTVARLDRRSYYSLWGEILRDEEADFKAMLDNFKMAHMGLGGGSVLVSGGIYPRVAAHTAGGLAHAAPRGLHMWR